MRCFDCGNEVDETRPFIDTISVTVAKQKMKDGSYKIIERDEHRKFICCDCILKTKG